MKEMQISYALNLLRLAIKEAINSIITDILGHKIAISMGGGLDTATILAMIKDLNPIAITVVNLGEHQLARTICDFLGVILVELYIDEDKFIKALEPSFQALQEPMAGLDIIPPTYIVLSEAKKMGADIVMTGDGGDELFFGYPWIYQYEFRYRVSKPIPKTVASKIVRLMSNTNLIWYSNIISTAIRILMHKVKDVQELEGQDKVARWYKTLYDTIAFDSRGPSRVEEIAQSLGLVFRAPFLNRKFIETVFQIPPNLKQPSKYATKLILRELLLRDGILPREVVLKPKKGFASDIWFSSNIVNERVRIISEESKNLNLNPKVTHRAYKAKDLYTLSALTGLILWYRKFTGDDK